MPEIIEAEHVATPTTTEVYLVMVQHGESDWRCPACCKSLDIANRFAESYKPFGFACIRIVRVSGLPIETGEGKG